MLSFTVSAQFVLFNIPVKDAVTKQAINAKGKIYLVTDTADAHTGNNVFCILRELYLAALQLFVETMEDLTEPQPFAVAHIHVLLRT